VTGSVDAVPPSADRQGRGAGRRASRSGAERRRSVSGAAAIPLPVSRRGGAFRQSALAGNSNSADGGALDHSRTSRLSGVDETRHGSRFFSLLL